MVPPPSGWGWQRRVTQGASGSPSLSRASRRPSLPWRKNVRRAGAVEGAASGAEFSEIGPKESALLVLLAMPVPILDTAGGLFWLHYAFGCDGADRSVVWS